MNPIVRCLAALMIFVGGVLSVSSGAQAFEVQEMLASASKMGAACNPQRWNSGWLGPESAIRTYEAIAVRGTDLANYKVNSEPTVNHLYRLNAVALRSRDTTRLRSFFMQMVARDQYTRMDRFVPTSWEGTKPGWLKDYAKYNAYDEAAFSGGILLIAAAQSYAILKPELTAAERRAVDAWGAKLARLVKKRGAKASDAKAVRSAAFTAWGSVSGDRRLYKSGVSLFRNVVGGIRKDGSERYFTDAKFAGKELRYHNMTYGFLTIAAWIIEKNGGKGFTFAKGGGTLLDGLNFLIRATFDRSARTRISAEQDVRHARGTATTASSLAYIEFAIDAGYGPGSLAEFGQVVALRNDGRRGYYSGYYGGYTTCIAGG